MTEKTKNILILSAVAGLFASMIAVQWSPPTSPLLDDDDSAASDDDDSSRFGNLPPAPKK